MRSLPTAGLLNAVAPRPTVNAFVQGVEDTAQWARERITAADPVSPLTLSGDTLTLTQSSAAVEGEATAADNLAAIAVSGIPDGTVALLRCYNASHAITVKHTASGSGHIELAGAADLVLNDTTMWLLLKLRGTTWYEVLRSWGSNKTGFTAWLNAATDTVAGIIKAATIAITRTGTATDTAVTPDALASLWQQGADIASAATLTKPSDANLGGYHVITGTVAVSAMWAGTKAGEEYEFEAGGALPLTHGSNLVMLSGASIVCAAGDRFRLRFFGSSLWKMVSFQRADGRALITPSSVVRDYLAGLTMSNNVATPNTKIDVAAGSAADSANADMIDYAGGTLNLATTGANGLRTGSLANDTWYGVFVIKGTTGVALFADTALTPGTRPAGYTAAWRRIGAFLTDGSAHVIGFIQTGREFWLKDPANIALAYSAGISSTPTAITLNLPTGKKWPSYFRAQMSGGIGNPYSVGFWDPDGPDQNINVGATPLGDMQSNNQASGASAAGGAFKVVTNTSAQIKSRSSTSSALLYLALTGWVDDGL